MHFKGKTSPWWYLFTLAINAILLYLIARYHFNVFSFLYIIPGVAADLYLIPVILCNYAEIEDKTLRIQFGLSREEIPIANLLSLQQIHRFGLSYCASSDGILLTSRGDERIVISLRENAQFMKELQKRNKKIHVFL